MSLEKINKILKKALAGDRLAGDELWRIIFNETYKISKRICRKKNIPPTEVDDIVQDSILVISRQEYDAFLAIRNWRSWIFTIVNNKALDHIRRTIRVRQSTVSLNNPISDNEANETVREYFLEAASSSPEKTVVQRDLIKKALKFIDTLPKENRDIFRLYLYGEKYVDIGEKMGKPTNTVSIIIYRIKHKIARLIKN